MVIRRATLVYGGGGTYLFFIVILMFTTVSCGTAQAQGELTEHSTSLGDYLATAGIGGILILLLGLTIFLVTVIGAASVRREGAWPHWRPLIHGLGQAAFLLAILFSVTGMIQAFNEITRLGACVTPRDMSVGLSSMLVRMQFGCAVAVFSLICAGVLCLVEPRREAE